MSKIRVFLLLTLALLISAGTAVGRGTPAQPAAGDEPVVVRLYFHDREHLNAVAGELDIWEVHPAGLYVVVAVKPAEYQWLEEMGYRLEIDAEKTALLGIEAPLDPRFHYFDDYFYNSNDRYMVDFMQDTNAAYPDLTELVDIGNAWEGDHGGYDRDMWVLRITNEDPAYGAIEDKPAFFLFAGIHAREVAIPELAIRYIKYLTTGYNGEGGYDVDPDVTWLVNFNTLYVLVSQNPDGHVINEQDAGAYWRKNVDNDDGCPDPNSWGVDLNRNHSFLWGCCGGSSGSPCSETYRGPSAGSEPETEAFQDYFATVMLDQNGPNGDDEIPPAAPDDATGIFLTLHSYQDEIYWPWAFDDYGPAPNDAQLETIGWKLAYFTGYEPAGTIDYDVDGASDDWTYGKFGVASFTFEVGPFYGSCGGFFPAYECIDGAPGYSENFWAENKPTFLYMHKIARTPYMTSYGPDTEDVVVTPDSVPQGAPVDLTATIADHRLPDDPLPPQPIAAAEYFLDAPGEDGTGIAMSPSDGSWGGITEGAEAVVDTSSLAPGKHLILVHGQNDDGDWGPFTAVFLSTTVGTPPEEMGLEASPLAIPIVYGEATITATLTLSDGTPTPGWVVTFTTDLGTVDPPTAVSDVNGNAVTTLYAGAMPGTAQVTAEGGGLSAGPVEVEFYVPDPPVAGFTSDSPVCVDVPVVFTNTTSGPPGVPADYLWDFGDGITSTLESPTHAYAAGGTYEVSLTASNPGGDDTYTDTVEIIGTPQAAFTFTPQYPAPGEIIHFTDQSTGDPLAWAWDFGDGGQASTPDPFYAYSMSGTYTVTLEVQNICGWGEPAQQMIYVGAEPPQMHVYLPLLVR
jgi:PKD repeat protein